MINQNAQLIIRFYGYKRIHNFFVNNYNIKIINTSMKENGFWTKIKCYHNDLCIFLEWKLLKMFKT